MDTDLLRCFLAITETGSFTVAGQRLGRTQSAVSQQMKRLEDTLGRPLFERAAGAVALTEHGQRSCRTRARCWRRSRRCWRPSTAPNCAGR